MTPIYIVALDDAQHVQDTLDQLAKAYKSKNVFAATDSMLLVRSASSCKSVADSAGLSEERVGVVFRLGSGYSGFMERDFWQWLRE